MKSKKLENLEKKFGMAAAKMDELDDLVGEFVEIETVTDLVPVTQGDLVAIDEPVFTIQQLKQDFYMVKQNLNSLIVKGQKILDAAMILDIADLKASQVDALTNLQNSIANNLKMMISIYKEIAEIEKMRNKGGPAMPMDAMGAVNMGTVTNNNIVFSGSPNDLMEFINKHKSN